MKKLKVLFISMFLLMFAGYAMATTIALTATSTHDVGDNGQVVKSVYTSTDSIATDNSTIFKINTPQVYGNIREWTFESSSTDCDYFISEGDNQTATSAQTILYVTGANLGYSPELTAPRYYRNRDTVADAFLYFTIDNDDAVNNTGNWNLNITYGK